MSNINDVRTLMELWKKRTFEEEIDYFSQLQGCDKDLYTLYLEVVKMQKLASKRMDGFSVEKLPIKFEGTTDVMFTEVFDKSIKGYFSPGSYILYLIRECKEKGIKDSYEVAGIVGRGYRTFPAFIRELDLTFKIATELQIAECIRENTENDIVNHTDVLVKYNGELYHLWSYQSSDRGLDNTGSRLSEYRGSLPFGYHVLCPFDAFSVGGYEEADGWRFYNQAEIKMIADKIKGKKADNYSDIRKMSRAAIRKYLIEPHLFCKIVKEEVDMTYEARRIINCIYFCEKYKIYPQNCLDRKRVISLVLGEEPLQFNNDMQKKEAYKRIRIEGRTKDELDLLIKQMISDNFISQSSGYSHVLKLGNFDALKKEDRVYHLKKY